MKNGLRERASSYCACLSGLNLIQYFLSELITFVGVNVRTMYFWIEIAAKNSLSDRIYLEKSITGCNLREKMHCRIESFENLLFRNL